MYISTALTLLSALTIVSAIPTSPPHVRLLPRKNATADGTEVARAGGFLNAEAAAEAQQRDSTATRAFSAVSLKAADGSCLSVDPTAGDFRQNLIPVQTKACDGSANEKFDIVTVGKHISQEGGMLVVSTETQGCLNFDPRRAAGDQVILFSCGGRADGEGIETDSQIFSFTAGQTSFPLKLKKDGETCLAINGGKLGSAGCSGDASQDFTIG
ncbi:MAG: hypothetical protein L6R40_002073 [Gallowayella cf. fulva]|nr:MAG: hypothetical protein L6R40_002073 [Xanthomendoza cf. fulva]